MQKYECPTQDLVRFLGETCDHNSRNILGEQPFQNFSLSSREMWRMEESRKGEKITETLWKAIGQFASRLQIKIQTWNHSLDPIMREPGPNETRLEVIWETNNGYGYGSDFSRMSSHLLKGPIYAHVKRLELSSRLFTRFSFLIKFPNLEELKISSLKDSSGGDSDLVISTLRTFRFSKKRKNICNLKHLDLIKASAQDITSFVGANLLLTFLTLRLEGSGMSHFQRCMEHYAKSLKTLKIRIPAHFKVFKAPGFLAHINFSNLQVLELWGFVIDNLNFLKGVPLRKLRLDLLCNELTKDGNMNRHRKLEHSKIDGIRNIVENSGDILGNVDFQCLKVQELLLDFQLSEESLTALGRWMPNLRILETPLDNTSFRLVCAQWPKLRKLGCRLGSEINDDGIVGERKSQEDSNQPTILDLEYLECFELEAPCGQGKITDRSAEFGYLKMNYLRNLKASVAPNLVTEDIEMQLKAQIGHLEICRKCRNENIPLKPRENVCCHWAAAVSNRLQS